MKYPSVLLLCFIQYIVFIESQTNPNRSNTFDNQQLAVIKQSITPDVIDTVPKNSIKVSYPSGVTVNLGNELTTASVRARPKVEWPVEASDALYTLCMTDPDAFGSAGEFNHWLVVNIPGPDVRKGQTLAAYTGSAPPKGSGLHRYVFLVYKQQTRIQPSEPGRHHFRIKDFAKKYNLGEPIAVNFYQAQYSQTR